MNHLVSFIVRNTGQFVTLYGASWLVQRVGGPAPGALAVTRQPSLARGVATVALGNLVSHPVSTASSLGRSVSALTGTLRGDLEGWNSVMQSATSRLDTLQHRLSDLAATQLQSSDMVSALAGQQELIDVAVRDAINEQSAAITQRQHVLVGGLVITAICGSYCAYKVAKGGAFPVNQGGMDAFKRMLEEHEVRMIATRNAFWTSMLTKSVVSIGCIVVLGGVIYTVWSLKKNDDQKRF